MEANIIEKVSRELAALLDSSKVLMDTAGETISLKNFQARLVLIGQLTSLLQFLPNFKSRVEKELNTVNIAHSKELALMDSLVNRNSARPKSYVVAAQSKVSKEVSLPNTPSVPHEHSKIKLTEALQLSVIRVQNFNDVKQNGDLYYVESCDHFAFMIAGKLFHGNVGTIYTDEKNPEKIKDCKFATSCTKKDKCDYYHDPTKFSGSHDHRNYIASSWLYAPPDSQYKNRPRSRRFGSREHLDTDIVDIHGDEIDRFYDQTTHDVLCALLLYHSHK